MDTAVLEGIARWDRARLLAADPFLTYTDEDWAFLEELWLQDLARTGLADLEGELEYTLRSLVRVRTNPDFADGAVDGVLWEPHLEQRAAWLTHEIQERKRAPESIRVGTKIPSDFIDRLKERCDLPSMLRSQFGMELKPSGREYIARCPFHDERTPSFRVRSDHWKCFGQCLQAGDVFDILIVSSTCRTWREAVEWVARYVNLEIPRPAPAKQETKQRNAVPVGPRIQSVELYAL